LFEVDVLGRALRHHRNRTGGVNQIMTTAIIEERRCFLPDAAASVRAGMRIAAGTCGGMVIALSGELGTGKTTLVRGILKGLGWSGTVKSPSYTLVEHYIISSLYFYHFDFYRFGDPDEWRYTGFAEYFRPDSICVIEWPERIGNWLPRVDLAVRLEYSDSGRALTLRAATTSGRACLDTFSASAK
jgi:tRNA threonylcarbamoyladenosine biosynthesis protein TsaE